MSLSPVEREELLSLARASLAAALTGEAPPRLASPSPRLTEPHGTFVTLYQEGSLRGCVGRVRSSLPLWATVVEVTRASALDDPRFLPLQREESDSVQVQISVLGPLARVADLGEIRTGVHGLHVRKGDRTGVLLPQVATRLGWDRGRFYAEVLRKAGIASDPNEIAPDIEASVFEAQVFPEELG